MRGHYDIILQLKFIILFAVFTKWTVASLVGKCFIADVFLIRIFFTGQKLINIGQK